MITIDNYEEYMIMQADGELQPHEEQALQAFLLEHPQLQAEMDIYSSIRLEPDHSQIYEHKAALLKPEQEKKTIAFPAFRTYAAAAGIVALLGIGAVVALRNGATNSAGNQVAMNQPAHTTTATHQAAAPVATTPAADTPAALPQHAVPNSNPGTQMAAVHTTPGNRQIWNATNNTTAGQAKAQPAETILAATARTPQQLAEIKTAELKTLPVSTPELQTPMMAANYELPGMNAQPADAKQTWFDKLPLDEGKKKNISNVATAVVNGCEKINTFKERVENNGISLRIQRKNLIVSF